MGDAQMTAPSLWQDFKRVVPFPRTKRGDRHEALARVGATVTPTCAAWRRDGYASAQTQIALHLPTPNRHANRHATWPDGLSGMARCRHDPGSAGGVNPSGTASTK